MLVVAVLIAVAALTAGLNVAQVAHAQSKGTCVVGPNSAGNPTSNPVSGNPHCFDPEQQPLGTTSPGGAYRYLHNKPVLRRRRGWKSCTID